MSRSLTSLEVMLPLEKGQFVNYLNGRQNQVKVKYHICMLDQFLFLSIKSRCKAFFIQKSPRHRPWIKAHLQKKPWKALDWLILWAGYVGDKSWLKGVHWTFQHIWPGQTRSWVHAPGPGALLRPPAHCTNLLQRILATHLVFCDNDKPWYVPEVILMLW